MSTITNIFLFTFLASGLSLVLVGFLLLHKNLVHRISFHLVSFAAGALLATGFLDTLKESVDRVGDTALLWTTIAIAGFFVIERLFLSVHHHEDEGEQETLRMPTGLLLFGDGLHNFIDGISIAASFLADPRLGIVTSIAVFIHEIPHELGDFGILLHKGWGRKKVFLFNAITGMTALIGASIGYLLGSSFEHMTPILLAITSGNFIYLAMTDLLPEIHHKAKKGFAFRDTAAFLGGMILVILLTHFLAV